MNTTKVTTKLLLKHKLSGDAKYTAHYFTWGCKWFKIFETII